MDTICRNCHFLAKESQEGGKVHSFPLNESERKVLQSSARPVPDHYSLQCHHGVWDEGLSGSMDIARMDVELNKTPRESECFFFRYRPSMLFKAAEEMQKRQEENRQLKKSYEHTRIALYIAAGALLVDAIIGILTILKT